MADGLRPFPFVREKGRVENHLPRTQPPEAEKRGRDASPSYLLYDSQTVKTNYEGERRGFHAGKKVKGRGRQVAVYTQGNLWGVHVHAGNLSDTKEGCVLADRVTADLPEVRACCAGAGYRGTFVEHLRERWDQVCHITARKTKGFEVEAKRWVVERTFGWNNGWRRLSKDYEKTTDPAEAFIYLAAISRSLNAIDFC